MAFTNFVIGANTFIPTAPGYYSLSTRGYSDPANQIKIGAGKRTRDGAKTVASLTRLWQKERVAGDPATRYGAEVTLVITTDVGIIATEIDALIGELSTVATPTNLDQILAGAN